LDIFAFFKDDHNRIIRVVVFPDTRTICVHILHMLPNGEKAWVPLKEFDLASLKNPVFTDDIEAPGYLKELTEKARQCPLFNKE